MQDIRLLVYTSLIKCIENERYSNLEADATLERCDLDARDKAFYCAMFYGVTERQITLDHQIRKLSSTPPEKLQTSVNVLLRMGLYQILFMKSVPDHAAVSQTVALAKQKVNRGAVGYINAILRSAQSKLKDENGEIKLMLPDKEKDLCGHLSIKYSFPRFLCKLWVNAYGAENAERIMIAQNARTVTTLRVNTLVTNRETLLSQLKNDGAEAFESELCDDGINLKSGAVASLYGFDSGHFFVQDDSSRLCVEALAPEEGETVLDACACPGGKSFASGIRMKNIGKIVSCDLHESKLSLITGGAERLGIGIIEAFACDSSVYRPEWNESFDRVLCDVPCSGYGTIAKKPDLRLKKPESASSLADVQLNIACNCARYLKKGGTMVYSTCTLNPKENEENVKRFLEENKDFELISMTTKFPYEGLCDGFFFAKMIKK